MRHPSQQSVLELRRLRLDCPHQAGMAVAQVYAPPRRDAIQQNSSVDLMKPASFGGIDDREGRVLEGRNLRVGVPYVLDVATAHFGVIHSRHSFRNSQWPEAESNLSISGLRLQGKECASPRTLPKDSMVRTLSS